MSRENVELVRRGIEAFRAGDFDTWFGTMSAGIKLFPNPREPGAKAVYEGQAGVREYLGNWYAGWDEYASEPTQFIDAGDCVVVAALETGVAKASGIRVEEEFSHVFRVEDGRVVEWRQFGPLQEALNAVGLRK